MALIIFTGNAPLTHLLDESIESLMLALDRRDAPRPFDYFRQVHHKRSDDDASPFEFPADSPVFSSAFCASASFIRRRVIHPAINEMVGMTCLAVFDLRRICLA